MKISDIVKLSFLNIKQNKLLNVIVVLILFISFFTVFIYLFNITSLNNYKKSLEDSLGFRTIEFCYNSSLDNLNNIEEKISNIDHVEMILPESYSVRAKLIYGNNQIDVNIKAFNDDILKELNISSDNENINNGILIPENLYLDIDYPDENFKLDGKVFENTDIKIEYAKLKYLYNVEENGIVYSEKIEEKGKETEQYKVLKAYNNKFYTEKNTVFVSKDKLLELNNKYIEDKKDENHIINVTVDNVENMDQVWKKILELNVLDREEQKSRYSLIDETVEDMVVEDNVYTKLETSKTSYIILIYITLLMVTIMTSFSIYFLYMLNKIQIIEYKKQIALLRVQGFSKKQIKSAIVIQNCINGIIAYLLSIILFIICKNNILKIFLYIQNEKIMPILNVIRRIVELDMANYFAVFVIPIIIYIVLGVILVNIHYRNIDKKQIIENLTDE